MIKLLNVISWVDELLLYVVGEVLYHVVLGFDELLWHKYYLENLLVLPDDLVLGIQTQKFNKLFFHLLINNSFLFLFTTLGFCV